MQSGVTHTSLASSMYQLYLHCGGRVQSGVTHSSLASSLYLQWKPAHNYQGRVTIMATIVRDDGTYWTGVTSGPVAVLGDSHDESTTKLGETSLNDDNLVDAFDIDFGKQFQAQLKEALSVGSDEEMVED